ncbi:MAG TPA: hypothetical protein VF070_14870 [Streptosporangiaceae bacterium]
MTVLIVRYTAADDGAEELTTAVKEAFAAVAEANPPGMRYDYYRIADSNDYVAVVELAEGAENPLRGIAGVQALSAVVKKWAIGESAPQPAELLGSYSSL